MRGATRGSSFLPRPPVFQSTLPMRGATIKSRAMPRAKRNFNPRSPCGERPKLTHIQRTSDVFQSTLPMRGATAVALVLDAKLIISIHAPHAGSDCAQTSPCAAGRYFNPRSPCGERLGPTLTASSVPAFQSTLPMRGATVGHLDAKQVAEFQSTLPMRGATRPGPD